MRQLGWLLFYLLLTLPAAAQNGYFGGIGSGTWFGAITGGIGGGNANGTVGTPPAPKPTIQATGPSSVRVATTSTPFTVTLLGATFSGAQTVTISDGGHGGTLTPSVGAPGTGSVTVTPAAAATGFTFTYANAVAQTITLTFTNAQGWNNQSPLTIIVNNVYTASGPGTGNVNVPSTAFTVTLSTGTFNGSNSITISDGSRGGTFFPSLGGSSTSTVTVTPTTGTTSFTFTYTPIVVATINLSFTNNSSFIDPAPLTYVSTVGVSCVQGSLKFNGKCTPVWMTNYVVSP